MKSVVVQTIAKHLRIDARPAGARVFQFLDNERSAAFAHDKSISQGVKWATCQNRITCPSAHGFDNIEGANRNRRKRRFGAARHDDICKIVANVSECFADRYCAASAAVGICRAYTTKAEFDGDIRMR